MQDGEKYPVDLPICGGVKVFAMVRILRYAISTILSLLMACTLFFSVGLYVDFGKKLTGFVTVFSVLLVLLLILTWIVAVIHNKVSTCYGQAVFSEKEMAFWRAVTWVFFFGFTICFGVRSEILDYWERGSELYMNALAPVAIPLHSELIVELVGRIGNGDLRAR